MLNLNQLLAEIEALADQPPPLEFAEAALNDFLLSCSLTPLSKELWNKVRDGAKLSKSEEKLLVEKKFRPPFTSDQIAIFATWGLGTTLYEETRSEVLAKKRKPDSFSLLIGLFQRLRGVPADIMARVRFRREEALRAWASAFGLEIQGETAKDSYAKLLRLDYFGVMSEALKAETSHDIKARQAALKKMEEEKKAAAAAAARGNYE
ncbi:MAG: hypothetical protein U0136_07885 [Bdellovibrionota bacterium]